MNDSLDERFMCERFQCRLRIRWCLERRARVWRTGGPKNRPVFPACARCEQGAAIAQAHPGFTLPFRHERQEVASNVQRAARAKYFAAHLYEHGEVELDPVREAASLVPDGRLEQVESA